MTALSDLVLTFCPKMRCVPQRKLKLLMPALPNTLAADLLNCVFTVSSIDDFQSDDKTAMFVHKTIENDGSCFA